MKYILWFYLFIFLVGPVQANIFCGIAHGSKFHPKKSHELSQNLIRVPDNLVQKIGELLSYKVTDIPSSELSIIAKNIKKLKPKKEKMQALNNLELFEYLGIKKIKTQTIDFVGVSAVKYQMKLNGRRISFIVGSRQSYFSHKLLGLQFRSIYSLDRRAGIRLIPANFTPYIATKLDTTELYSGKVKRLSAFVSAGLIPSGIIRKNFSSPNELITIVKHQTESAFFIEIISKKNPSKRYLYDYLGREAGVKSDATVLYLNSQIGKWDTRWWRSPPIYD
ncbi:MAG: hypothetical protein AB8E15_06440 [Bdellovibrionales bacterium]